MERCFFIQKNLLPYKNKYINTGGYAICLAIKCFSAKTLIKIKLTTLEKICYNHKALLHALIVVGGAVAHG